ncbi:MAG: glycosyltransferase family 25 protein [Candidatus Sumerlaeota bacterium]|nr:glycosyltransferase family 25 protein [Candidatus Sumerlaeota bacterium]
MKTFIINIAKDTKRRHFISRQMDKLKLEHEYFNAIVGKDLTTAELRRSYNHSKAMRTQCRDLTPSEIGCALSHIGIYRLILARRLPMALILEDDTVLSDEINTILGCLQECMHSEHPMLTLLSPVHGTKGAARALGSGHQMQPFSSGFFTNGYVITAAGARALVKFLYPVGDVADCWRRLQRHGVIDLYAVTPPLALQNREAFGSITSAEIGKFLKGRARWWKYLFKARRAFWLGVDQSIAFFDRHFRPYAGLDLKRER